MRQSPEREVDRVLRANGSSSARQPYGPYQPQIEELLISHHVQIAQHKRAPLPMRELNYYALLHLKYQEVASVPRRAQALQLRIEHLRAHHLNAQEEGKAQLAEVPD